MKASGYKMINFLAKKFEKGQIYLEKIPEDKKVYFASFSQDGDYRLAIKSEWIEIGGKVKIWHKQN